MIDPGAQDPSTRSVRALRLAGKGAFAVWAVVLTLVAAVLGIRHWAALPRPDDVAALGRAMTDLRAPGGQGLLVVHVLFADCRCSRRVLDALGQRPPVPGRQETVLLVGSLPDVERDLRARGVAVVHAEPEELLTRYHVESAPLFVVVNGEGRVQHVGGYTAHKQALVLRDREVVDAIARGGSPTPLPVFGCPVSDRLRRATLADLLP